MATYNQKKDAINALIDNGGSVLEVEIQGQSRFFKTQSFEPPVGGSVSSAPFIRFTGIDITEFLEGTLMVLSDVKSFLSVFDNKFGQVKGRKYQFSDLHIWRYFE